MAPKGLTSRFFESIFPLLNWKYNPATLNQNALENRGLVDKFVFQPLADDQKNMIVKRAKTNRMPIPPPLDSIIDIPSVTDQVNLIISRISEGKSLADIYKEFTPENDGVSVAEFNLLLSEFFK